MSDFNNREDEDLTNPNFYATQSWEIASFVRTGMMRNLLISVSRIKQETRASNAAILNELEPLFKPYCLDQVQFFLERLSENNSAYLMDADQALADASIESFDPRINFSDTVLRTKAGRDILSIFAAIEPTDVIWDLVLEEPQLHYGENGELMASPSKQYRISANRVD